MAMFKTPQETTKTSSNKTLFKEASSEKDDASSLFGKVVEEEKTETSSKKDGSTSIFGDINETKVKRKKTRKKIVKNKDKPIKLFKPHRASKTFLDISNIVRRTDERTGGLYVLRDGTYMKFFQVNPKDIMSRNSHEQLYDMGVLLNMLKTYNKDNKIIALNMPIDTETQRSHLIRKYEKEEVGIYRYFLEQRIKKLEYLEQSSRMERSFLAMLFGKTAQELNVNIQTYKKSMARGFPIKTLTKEQEIKILYKLNNQCEEIK
ncbi:MULTISPECIES: hypothetical protein [Staphylococcus]|uniref:hypothetical protein n=1 Tax=Staphylococcus TaxID=1279 RepID=UPI0019531E79|nr:MULTISPECIES: hypothetical protein [Staphylococcus]MCT2553848.1 hypothetical protein [Staphylococcus aureus]MCT2569018.1 hypothetical protein [Staphylococcus aureus]MCT2572856.1 hypothetical protein [Staphylococcus aureus]MCT2575587.1 hypothetical protein [Staphylococcus aureus]MEA1207894.1 hypothetical protein [Staphylococcus aureus]